VDAGFASQTSAHLPERFESPPSQDDSLLLPSSDWRRRDRLGRGVHEHSVENRCSNRQPTSPHNLGQRLRAEGPPGARHDATARELPGDGSKGVPWTSTPTETECCRAAPTSAAWLERVVWETGDRRPPESRPPGSQAGGPPNAVGPPRGGGAVRGRGPPALASRRRAPGTEAARPLLELATLTPQRAGLEARLVEALGDR
jgi:hypothetical protein